MKNVFKTLGVIALAAIIGFSFAACDDGGGGGGGGGVGGLSAPTGLRVQVSGSTIYVTWNSVPGAVGYYFYASTSPSFTNVGSERVPGTSYTEYDIPAGTYYCRVSAYNANGEGAVSSAVSFTIAGTSYSLNGTWVRDDDGVRVRISGSTGTITAFGSRPYWLDAAQKGIISVGDAKFRNLSSAGSGTWTGQELVFNTNAAQTVTNSVSWSNVTITMTDGNTFQSYDPGSSDPYAIWRRVQ